MIPKPREAILSTNRFLLPAKLMLANVPDDFTAAKLQQAWHKLMQFNTYIPAEGSLEICWHGFAKVAATHKDMHMLLVEPYRITLSAKSKAGWNYALSTLLQLLFVAIRKKAGYLQCQTIVDYPAYDWRGLHLDESRHFLGMNTVKQMLKRMAAMKLNKFHWHLTDDQGWRIESKLFPRLTDIGAWRTEADGTIYGGFYTQDDIREIIDYADNLGIEVIPELDLPGHVLALLSAYPEFACFPSDFKPLTRWGISEDILCAGNDSAMEFLSKLLQELADLFTGNYFHIGGDEAPKQNWQSCPQCQKRISSEGLANEEELQSWLISGLVKVLKNKGKTVIGWDEILDGNIDSAPIVMAWRGDGKAAAKKASTNGNRFILCPNTICYFDWKQSTEGAGAHGVSTLENVYNLDPDSYGENHQCLGGQANLWTEYIHDAKELFNMMLPRAYALSERLWNPVKDFNDFSARLTELEAYLETLY